MEGLSELRFDADPSRGDYDAVVIGSGPNGLAAAITIARQGRSVLVVEARSTIGGGMRSAELTLPGHVHDVCAAVHALAVVSPFFRDLPLEDHGLQWVYPEAAVAHPLDDGQSVLGYRSLEQTASALGDDADRYHALFGKLVERSEDLFCELLGPLRPPRHPLLMARFGLLAIQSAARVARKRFESKEAQALFAGHSAHSIMPLERRLTASFGIMLALTAHAGGWPVARGGSQRIADAMARYLVQQGGELVTGHLVEDLNQLPTARAYLFDTSPQALVRIAGEALPEGYCRKLERFRFGPGVFKVDWALDGPIPWQSQPCAQAATVHLGGTLEEISESERAAWNGRIAERPFVLLAQQSLFDSTRAPQGKQIAWGYCHVPSGSQVDMTSAIEAQVERFAPGFGDQIASRHVMNTANFEEHNPNYVGGDITGGVMDLRQIIGRPVIRWTPYRTPNPQLFICSASTPPGAGVHGMCGFHAAKAALRGVLRKNSSHE